MSKDFIHFLLLGIIIMFTIILEIGVTYYFVTFYSATIFHVLLCLFINFIVVTIPIFADEILYNKLGK